MNKRYILSALIVAALAVACDTKSDDPVPTVPGSQPTVPVPSDTIPVVPTQPIPSDTIPVQPTQPVPSDTIPVQPTEPGPTVIPTPELPVADVIEITPADTTVSSVAHAFTVQFSANGLYEEDLTGVPSWVEYYFESDNVISIAITANPNSDSRVAELCFYSTETEAKLKITQQGREGIQAAEGTVNSTISAMTGADFVLGPIPMELTTTLTYSITCAQRNYSQGTLTISKNDLCSALRITTDDFDARKGVSIVCVPMNKDWTEGENTAAGAYGAWFGSSGTVAWGSSSIAYLEGNDMLSFGYGMHPDNRSSSCVCRLQYQDKQKEMAVNVEVTVSLQ